MSKLPLIIEPNDLEPILDQDNLLIVDLTSEANYLQAHIPGAVFLPFKALMAGTPPAPGRLPEKAQLEHVFQTLGLTENTHVIAYDNEGGGWAGRLIWTLDVIGHKNYSYLNGGINAWLSEGLATTNEVTQPTPSQITLEIDSSPIVEIPDILEGLEKENFVVWDCRSPAEYTGEKVLAARGGHIPGAINCDWLNLMDHEQDLRIREDAENYLAELGIDKTKDIVCHCQSHHRSALAYLVGKQLGFKIRAYHGSWSEWGNRNDTPIES